MPPRLKDFETPFKRPIVLFQFQILFFRCWCFWFWRLLKLPTQTSLYSGPSTGLCEWISKISSETNKVERFWQRQIKLKQTSSGTDVERRTICWETATGRLWWRLLVRRSWRRWIRRRRSTRPDRLKLVLLELNLRKLHIACLTSSLWQGTLQQISRLPFPA